MKSPVVKELKPNENITAVFLVQAKEIRQKRTGEPYLSLTLSDRSGELDSKMWDNVAEVMDTFERDDFVKVRGLLQIYNSRPQFTVHKLRRIDDAEVDFADFFPASVHDPAVMWQQLRGIVAALDNRHIRDLLDAFLDDPDISTRYKVAPAAKTIHHAFRSGLLEHVMSLLTLAKMVGPHYPMVDMNLLIAGVVLHDIGKIYELSYDRGFGYSAEGQLVGHISIAIRMLNDKLRAFPDFPVPLRNLIEHLVLSHHGRLEFGSPKLPIFPEALLLHYLDDMDSKMECMRALIKKEPQAEGLFTAWCAPLERTALRKSRYLDADAATESKPRVPVAPEEAVPQNGLAEAAVHVAGAPKSASSSSSIFGAKLQQALQDERK